MKQIIKIESFSVASVFVPGFSLVQNQYLSLNFHNRRDVDIEQKIGNTLVGYSIPPRKIAIVNPPERKGGLFSKVHRLEAGEYLRRNTQYSSVEVQEILSEFNIRPDERVCTLGYNEKTLLALKVAYFYTKDVIINSSGIDYSGAEKIAQVVSENIKEGSLIEFNYPSSRGREYVFQDILGAPKVIETK